MRTFEPKRPISQKLPSQELKFTTSKILSRKLGFLGIETKAPASPLEGSQKSFSHTLFTYFHSLERVIVCVAWLLKSLMRKEIMSCLFKWWGQFLLTVQCTWDWPFTWACLFQKWFIGDFFSALMCNSTSRNRARKRYLLFCLLLLSSNPSLPAPPPRMVLSSLSNRETQTDTY